jgi:CubicO group peptidase (beta-lactamase class C family)
MKKNLLLSVFAAVLSYGYLSMPQRVQKADGIVITTKTVDSIVKKLMDTADVAGLQIGIINDNKPVYVNSYGYKNKAKKQLINTSTCVYAASLSKSLFAYIVMQLVDEGAINLDKPLYTYLPKPLPEYDNYKDLAGDDRWKLITARACLDHTTGFPNWREFNPHDNKKLEIFFKPGTRYAYSGEGIYLLQLVVETVTKRSLESLAQEKIFQPFGMTRTSYRWQPAFETDYANGHDMNGDTLTKHRRKSENAAGSMETTVVDYTRFMAAVMGGKRLSASTKKEMLSPQIAINSHRQFPSLDSTTTNDNKKIQLAYGLGWGLFDTPYGKAFFKEGHDDGWVNYVIGFPDKKIGLVIMCNSTSGESIFKELVEKLMGVTIPWYWEGYTPYRATVKLTAAQLQQFAGEYTGKLDAVIVVENGRLKVSSTTVNLPKTNLYASNDHHFFLKIMDTDIAFVEGPDGKVSKAVLNDEGEHYELAKIK